MRNQYVLIPILIVLAINTFINSNQQETCQHRHFSFFADTSHQEMFPTIPEESYDSIFRKNPNFWAKGYDYPVGKPNAEGYVLSQRFGENNHLGEDWNGKGGGNTDLGDPVYTVSDGLVTFSRHVCCGWGNVVRVIHFQPNSPNLRYVESIYAHLDQIDVLPGQLIKRGEQVGTIGTADGAYLAHLHLEMREFINMSLGPGYSTDQFGFLVPSDFIKKNR